MSLRPRRLAFVAGLGMVAALIAAPLTAIAAPAAPLAPASTVNVAVVVPLSVPGGREGYLDAVTLEGYTEAGGLLARELDALIGSPVAIGIDPMILASIRLLGSSAPDSALAWLERLRAAENDTFALTYGDSDLTLGLQAGSATVLAPTSFAYAIDSSLFTVPDPASTPDPAVTPAPDEPPLLPTSANLLDWAYTLESIAWPQPSTTTTADLEKLGAAEYGATILNSGNLKRTPAGAAHVTVGGGSAIVTDDALSALLGATLRAQSATEWQDAFATLSTGLQSVQGRGASGRASVVLAVGRAEFDTTSRLRSTITALENVPSVVPTTLTGILGEAPAAATLAEKPQPEVRTELTASMLAAEKKDTAFSTVAENPALITGDRRLRMLATLAPQWNRYPGGWGNEVARYLEGSERLRASVRLSDSSDLIFGDRGSLPIYVTNDLTQPVTVYIVVDPLTPLLTVEDSRFELMIEPGSNRRAAVPAVARSNGLVNLEISLHTATGNAIGTTSTVTTNVQAGWETPIIGALALLVFGTFGFGIFRTIKRRRQQRLPVTDVADAS